MTFENPMHALVEPGVAAHPIRVRQHLVGLRRAQRGVTLIELMVGIAIGLLVVAVAAAALMVSRGVSGTVSDASTIQQQAAYAMRVIGGQLRQAGSLYLNPNPGGAAGSNNVFAPVAFEQKATPSSGSGNEFDLAAADQLLTGTDDSVTIGFRRYRDPVFISADPMTLARNCLGGPSDSGAPANNDQRIESVFELTANGDLRCQGNGAGPQPIIQNVADFQVRYLIQTGGSTISYVTAADVGQPGEVQGVEVCLVLFGSEPIGLPEPNPARPELTSYRGCDGNWVDMTTLAGERRNRLHLVFRSQFQLRSQGLM